MKANTDTFIEKCRYLGVGKTTEQLANTRLEWRFISLAQAIETMARGLHVMSARRLDSLRRAD